MLIQIICLKQNIGWVKWRTSQNYNSFSIPFIPKYNHKYISHMAIEPILLNNPHKLIIAQHPINIYCHRSMINKFARKASNYSYYGYLSRYTPQQIRTYQSERMYFLGRRGAFNNLVLKYAADHINYEYKVPTFVTNVTMRLAIFWFVSASLILSFGMGDMLRVFRQIEWFYPGRPDTNPEQISHYETLYLIDRQVKF